MSKKKALTAGVLSALIAATAIPVASAAASSERLLGDVNNDGKIDITDATMVQKQVAKIILFDEETELAADVNDDGVITIVDATLIQKYVAKMDTGYPIGEPIKNSDTEPTTDAIEVTEATEATEANEATKATEATEPSTEINEDAWKENTGTITLSNNGIIVTGDGIYVEGNTVYITEGGDWEVTGTCDDGMIYVNTGEEKDANDKVKLRLNGMSLTNTSGPAIYFDRCKKAFITIESDTENYVSDSSSYSTENAEAKAAIHSDDSLEIKGKGTLYVTGNYKHGINSDDDIVIENGVINITSVKDGLHANDCITLDGKNVNLTVNSQSDGIDSEGYITIDKANVNITAEGKGIKADGDITITSGSFTVDTTDDCINGNANVTISGGTFDLTSDDEGITAAADLTVENAEINITSGGKGMKADADMLILSGTLTINSNDDSVHSNANITIEDGTLHLTSGDDGIHADTALTVNGGSINVLKSYEGLEGNDVIINGGTVNVTASDDGINAAGGNDQSSVDGRPGQNQFRPGTSSNNSITINDGYVYVVSSGDGIDSNGALNFNGGTVIVQGPSSAGNCCIDADGTISFNGGTVIGISSSNAMWQDVSGKVSSAIYNTSVGRITSGSTVAVTDSDGNVLSILQPTLTGNIGIVYMTDQISSLSSCKFVLGGTYSGTLDSFGYGEGGTVSGGTTVSASTAQNGNQGGRGGQGGFRP